LKKKTFEAFQNKGIDIEKAKNIYKKILNENKNEKDEVKQEIFQKTLINETNIFKKNFKKNSINPLF